MSNKPKVGISFKPRDLEVIEAVRMALAQQNFHIGDDVVRIRQHANLQYQADGKECVVALDSVKATVIFSLSCKDHMSYVERVIDISCFDLLQETWIQYDDQPCYTEYNSNRRSFYGDLTTSLKDRRSWIFYALTHILDPATASSVLFGLQQYPKLSVSPRGFLVLTYAFDAFWNVREIVAHYDRTRGYVYFKYVSLSEGTHELRQGNHHTGALHIVEG